MTDPSAVEDYLHRHIPISAAMGIRVLEIDDRGVRLAAVLEPNLNHRSTAFGGSVSSLAILSAWTLVHVGLRERGQSAHVVIQKSTTDFLRPIDGDMEAFCAAPGPKEWERLVDSVRRRGRGRMRLISEVSSGGAVAASFHGVYVAFASPAQGTTATSASKKSGA